MVVLIETIDNIWGSNVWTYECTKAHHYTDLELGGRTIQGDVLIEESALKEVARISEE